MCGIAGIIKYKDKIENEATIKNMMASIKHRGPDGEGTFIDNGVALGHVRLSIIDLTAQANQPLFSTDKNICIIFNGEIYNYLKLKKELIKKYEFKTDSDTEVIINAYREWGEECLHRLNGMFAFAIYDKSKNEIFCARDRFGIKPFYYYKDEENFIFASEIKGILASNIVKAEIDEKTLFDFIVFNRTDHIKNTCFKNIKNLRPGHSVRINLTNNELVFKQWYSLPKVEENKLSYSENEAALYEKLLKSIKLHLVSDVPVGSALSGGIDSSTIVSLMRQLLPPGAKIEAFSAIYDKNWEKDESKYIKIMAEKKKLNENYVYPNAESLLLELDDLIYQQEEPFASASIFASRKVYQKANEKNIKVLLNGQGADELFAYDYMAAFYFYELFTKFKWLKLIKELFLFYKKQAYPNFTFQLFAFLLAPDFLKNKLISISHNFTNKEFFNKYKNESNFNKNFFSSKTLNQNVKNHLLMKLHHLLRVEDKNSMTYSVEGRVPFLEKELVEFALNIPAKYKIKNGEVKYILKHAMKKLLPSEIFKRNNKIGYATPMDNWFREPNFIKYVDGMLNKTEQPMQEYLNINHVKEKWEKHKENKENNSKIIWKYLYLTRWHELFFMNNKD